MTFTQCANPLLYQKNDEGAGAHNEQGEIREPTTPIQYGETSREETEGKSREIPTDRQQPGVPTKHTGRQCGLPARGRNTAIVILPHYSSAQYGVGPKCNPSRSHSVKSTGGPGSSFSTTDHHGWRTRSAQQAHPGTGGIPTPTGEAAADGQSR